MARFRLIPREEKFYTDFQAMAENIRAAARLLEEMLADDPIQIGKTEEIKELEHRCDFLTHNVLQRLHQTFVTPIDREDIHALASALDNVMDSIDAAAHLFRQYRIDHAREGTRQFAHLIATCAEQLTLALKCMEDRKMVTPSVVEINRLENEADRLHQDVIMRLFDEQKDPITVIKWKEIFDFLESSIDRMEDVSDVIQGVILKHA